MDFKAVAENAAPFAGKVGFSKEPAPEGFPTGAVAAMRDVGLVGVDLSLSVFGLVRSPALGIAETPFTISQSTTEALKLRAAVFAGQGHFSIGLVTHPDRVGFVCTVAGAVLMAMGTLAGVKSLPADEACFADCVSSGAFLRGGFGRATEGTEPRPSQGPARKHAGLILFAAPLAGLSN